MMWGRIVDCAALAAIIVLVALAVTNNNSFHILTSWGRMVSGGFPQ